MELRQLALEFDYDDLPEDVPEQTCAKLESYAARMDELKLNGRMAVNQFLIDTGRELSESKQLCKKTQDSWEYWAGERNGYSRSRADTLIRISEAFKDHDAVELAGCGPGVLELLASQPKRVVNKVLRLAKDNYLTLADARKALPSDTNGKASFRVKQVESESDLHDEIMKKVEGVERRTVDDLKPSIPDVLKQVAKELVSAS